MSTTPGVLPTFAFNEIDEAVRLLDSPSEPWSIQLELRVRGRLDECRLRTALGEALARHPMARAPREPVESALLLADHTTAGPRCAASR
jgi:hypothetical protein